MVRDDGRGSHGTKGRLHPDHADALRAKDFETPPNNIVEWILVCDGEIRQILLG